MSNCGDLIEELISFGLKNSLMEQLDVPQVRNQLLDLLNIPEPSYKKIDYRGDDYPVNLLNDILNDAVKRGVIEDSLSQRDILDAKIMSQLLPRQSELYRKFKEIKDWDGINFATDYYYKISQLSNYIRTDRIAKNKYWISETESGSLEITINLSKPEKDPRDIAKAGQMVQSNYPKCLLCIENVGYAGNVNHPARSNHRVIPLTLNNEEWYFQYSPYVYYNEHAIIFKAKHEPMKISRESFIRLTDFVDEMPHYFIGSNADLPIVGGSILSHDHFQGGNHRFPMVDAKIIKLFNHPEYEGLNISMIEWPMSVIRISSSKKDIVVDYADKILKEWRGYSDENAGILAYSNVDGKKVPHNTITPIARKNDNDLFELDLVLRNNRCDTNHPHGIYHPHEHLHHIKKENIGLIEVMGLAILPARINDDIIVLSNVLQGRETLDFVEKNLTNHYEWFKEIFNKFGASNQKETADKIIKDALGDRFSEVLQCAGVYKLNDKGIEAFGRFIISTGARAIV